jgi:RNA polymerase sigma-70 factor (ECF subfamily)
MARPPNQAPESKRGSSPGIDPEAFAAQYCEVYPRLHLVATAIVGDRSHAHDLVQEAAIIALRKSDQFVVGSSFVAWLSEIVRRCSLNYARKVRGRRTTAADPDLLAQTAHRDAADGTTWPIRGETGELVEDQMDFDDRTLHALQTMSADARCCLLLRVVQELTYAEISELMQIPEGTAMSHVHRSKQQLRRLLAPCQSNPKVANEKS